MARSAYWSCPLRLPTPAAAHVAIASIPLPVPRPSTEPFSPPPWTLDSPLIRVQENRGRFIAGAQFRLGVVYAEGRGVAQDDKESVRWFRLAAEQGDAEAQGGLGLAYSAGRGVPQDFVASHMWITLAAARLTGATRHGALKFRDTIAAAMTSEQIAEAHRLAQEWTPTSER